MSTNEKEMAKLQQEAEKLRRMSALPVLDRAPAASTSAPAEPELSLSAEGKPGALKKKGFLKSSLHLEEELKDHWFPVEFSSVRYLPPHHRHVSKLF